MYKTPGKKPSKVPGTIGLSLQTNTPLPACEWEIVEGKSCKIWPTVFKSRGLISEAYDSQIVLSVTKWSFDELFISYEDWIGNIFESNISFDEE